MHAYRLTKNACNSIGATCCFEGGCVVERHVMQLVWHARSSSFVAPALVAHVDRLPPLVGLHDI
jgi:hypothetical protein